MLLAYRLLDWQVGVISSFGEPEAWLKATTLNLRFQDAGLDGTGGAILKSSSIAAGFSFMEVKYVSV
ncbi:hypothetical protein EDC26_12535 [Paralcaligenes ureilyticus]|uniref:Uncharacterized protein n=1 Tax=Paralcaligenes ureilyticus TaxID=627131 RepID=A0A4R3LLG6_9BURK|nr:hypothetical protein EDC26_12535 [Paralcaligenes ureilyticus]